MPKGCLLEHFCTVGYEIFLGNMADGRCNRTCVRLRSHHFPFRPSQRGRRCAVCLKLQELEEAIVAFGAGFDAALISAEEAPGVVERAARIEHVAATVKALAAARVADTDLWNGEGERSA